MKSIIGRRNFGAVWVCIAVLGYTAWASDTMVGVYYYPWYTGSSFHGGNPPGSTTLVYHLDPQQTPELGWYDQYDPNVISQHYQWARYAGIKFFVNSYWGRWSTEDNVIQNYMFDNPDRGDIKLCVFLEPSITPINPSVTPASITTETNYLCDNYFNRPGYFRIDGKPVIFIYITRAMSDSDLTMCISTIRAAAINKGIGEVYIVGDEVWGNPNVSYETSRVNQMDAISNYDVYGNLGGARFVTDSILNTWQSRNTSWKTLANDLGKQFIPAVSPGFNDRAVRSGHQPSSRKLNNESNAFGTLFSGMLDRADLTADMNMIMVTSWNEWHEDTQIEPVAAAAPTNTDDGGGYYTDDLYYNGYGMLYLDILRLFTGTRTTYYYVDADAPVGGNGQTWGTAYKYLQDALAASGSGDEILVAQGIYKPDDDDAHHPGGTGSRYATFQLSNGVTIKGGYAGYGAPDPNERDPNTYETILSGDLIGNDVGFTNNAENSYHVVTGSGTDETSVLDGFTIIAGNANGSSWPADTGGGMYNEYGSPTLTNCTFSGNSAEVGGGISNGEYCSPALNNCMFNDNSAEHGGGMINHASSTPTLTNCTFTGNSAGVVGGGMQNYRSSSELTNCMFTHNSARWGGGMNNHESSPMLTNCTFIGNLAEGGGGMANYNTGPTVTNCMFTANSAEWGGGMSNVEYSSPTLTNCILWGNTAPGGAQIYNDGTSSATVSYSCVQGYVEPTEPAIQGLIAHWRFDEGGGTVAYDSAGENHGIVYGAQWTTGKVGGALSFDGFDDHVIVPYSPAFDLGSVWTTAFWIYKQPFSGWSKIISTRRHNLGGYEFIVTGDGRIGFETFGPGSIAPEVTPPLMGSGVWSHVAFVSNGASVKYYVNGTEVHSFDFSLPISADSRDMFIGKPEDLDEPYKGILDEVAIYDRALSAEEVEQLYQYGLNQGNIDANPLFALDTDYHLMPDSPCIDAGDNTAVPAGVTTDLDGNPRFADDPDIPDTGNGTPPIVDMGAYEYNPPVAAEVDIEPETLNLQSKGVITAFIELPEPYSVEDIDLETVECQGAGAIRTIIAGDILIVKFDREELQELQADEEVELLVSGELADGTRFEGKDVIRVIDKGGKKKN